MSQSHNTPFVFVHRQDLGLALDAAAAAKAPLLLGGLSHQIFQLLSAHGLGAKDFSVVFKFLQDQAAAKEKK